jgi:hypothetical protein
MSSSIHSRPSDPLHTGRPYPSQFHVPRFAALRLWLTLAMALALPTAYALGALVLLHICDRRLAATNHTAA